MVMFDEPPSVCPPTPLRGGGRPHLERMGSLADTKLLANTGLRRSASSTGGSLEFRFSEHFDLVRNIGRSGTAEVFVARNRFDGSLSAVKRSLAPFHTRADRERCMHEIWSATVLPAHPHVVKYYRAWQQEGHFYIQLELCEGGSLKGALDRLPLDARLPEADVWRLIAEVTAGLQHLHDHGCIHLDVKPANILIGAGATFKVGDLGLAMLRGQWEPEEGDGAYVAPELLADESNASPACDVYSFGASLYECLTRERLPRTGVDGPVPLPPGWSATLGQLLTGMLARLPEHRVTLPQVHQVTTAVLSGVAPLR